MPPIAEGEYRPPIGVSDLYIAEVLTDDPCDDGTLYTTDTPVLLAPLAELALAPSSSNDPLYMDDGVFEVLDSEGPTAITVKVSAIPLSTQANILGRVFHAASGILWDAGGGAKKYFAMGYRSLKSDSSYRYVWFLKGKFQTPDEAHVTKGVKPDPKILTIVYTAIKTTAKWDLGLTNPDGVKRMVGDTDIAAFSAMTLATWIAQVQTPSTSGAPGALTVTSVPTYGYATFPKANDIVLTFSNKLADYSDIDLAIASTGADAGSPLVNSVDVPTGKVLTINPTGNLTTVAHVLSYHVRDIYGQEITGTLPFTAV